MSNTTKKRAFTTPGFLRTPSLNVLLFFLTVFTTWAIGGAAYSATLLCILICHEMGHYLTARYYGVKASLPYFIPVPFALGTFGAIIKMDDTIPHRRALVAIGAAGPLAGLAAAIPLLLYGLSLSVVAPAIHPLPGITDFGLISIVKDIATGQSTPDTLPLAFIEGNSILYWLAKSLVFDIQPGQDVWIHPITFAAWIGLFVTAVNMLPVGQLDGGHVAYGLWGERANTVADIVRIVLVGLGLLVWVGWLFWALIITVFLRLSGGSHPPVRNPGEPLGRSMRAIGFAALITFAITFSPAPLREIRLSHQEALDIPVEVKIFLGLCDEQINWLFQTQSLPLNERLRAGTPPDCP